ncbi:integrase [Sinirhodobacter populi]|uniref:Integrase n=1 Tax=Paenirhodobacter populi TaxID=2306993 RepID=A0A443K0A8_9RHOB|nr:tyrosine-type recombinase/integrase [Sinirhodobacter populi]RWR26218.1 integrase [Sinirhodobacter populi]
MSAWHDPDRKVIDTFLETSRLQPKSRSTYYRFLRSFEEVAQRHPTVDRRMLDAWLKKIGKRYQPSTLWSCVRIIDRFLDHLVEIELIAGNPIAALRNRYNVKLNKPIWRALASTNPDEALAALQRPTPYGSILGDFMRDHVVLMRNRGYQYKKQAYGLLQFDRFLQANPELAEAPLETMLTCWEGAKPSRNHAVECQLLSRSLIKARYRLDPSTPPKRFNAQPIREATKEYRRPHIFSPTDVQHMLDTARSYPSARTPLLPLTLYTMIVLAYCAGLRRSELARLDLGDADLQSGTITIRETKFYKTRILPLSDSVVVELRAYLDVRRRAGGSQDPQSGLFWHPRLNHRYCPEAVSQMITKVMRRAGFKTISGRTGPRVHDLRHSMVVNRILQWYQSGINPQEKLHFLSTYMGHGSIHSTLAYITVTQELLQEASERFRSVGARCLTMEAHP